MWRPIIIGIILFGNLALGQEKTALNEGETETGVIVDDQSPASSELVQTTSSESRSGLGKMGLLSTIKLVKDSTNMGDDMVAAGSLMNVFIQVSPDGTTDRDIKKVLEEVAAQGTDHELSTVPNKNPEPPSELPPRIDDYQGESNVPPYAGNSGESISGYRKGQSAEVGNEYVQQSETQNRVTSPLENHLQRVRAQILKQQQEIVEEEEREEPNSQEQYDQEDDSKHVIEIQSDRNKAYIQQQQQSDAARASEHVQKQKEREQQGVTQQALQDIANRHESIQKNSVVPAPRQQEEDDQEEGAESDPQKTTIQQVFPQVSFHHQAYLAQKALQDQVRAQQQVIHQQQIDKLQAMQQEAFQKQNEIWQSAMQQQKTFYEHQRSKQSQELQQQQEFYAQQQAVTQQGSQQQQAHTQQHQNINTWQHDLRTQALNDKRIFEGGQGYPQQPILYPMEFNQQQVQPEFNQQSLNEGYNPQQQPEFNQQTSFNQYQQQPPIIPPVPTPVQPVHLGTPLQFVPPSPFPVQYQQPNQPNFNQQPQQQQQGFDRQALQQGFNNQHQQQPQLSQQQGQQPFRQGQQQGQQQGHQQGHQQGQQPFQGQQQGQQPFQGQQQGRQPFQGQPQGQQLLQGQQQGQQPFQGQQPNQQHQQRHPFQQQPVDVPHSQVPQLSNQIHNQHQAQESENNFQRYQPQAQQGQPQLPSPVQPSQFLDANQEQPSLPNAALHSSAEQIAPAFSPIRETPLYTIYKVNEDISPAALNNLAHIPQRTTLYTVSTPPHLKLLNQNIPTPAINDPPPSAVQQQQQQQQPQPHYIPPSPFPNYEQPQGSNQQHQQGYNQQQSGFNQQPSQQSYKQQQQQPHQQGFNQQQQQGSNHQQSGYNQQHQQQGYNQQQQSGFNQQPLQDENNNQDHQPNTQYSEQSHAIHPSPFEPLLPVVVPLLGPVPPPPPVSNFAGITFHHPSPTPFLGPNHAQVSIFSPRPTPFIQDAPILHQSPVNHGPPPPHYQLPQPKHRQQQQEQHHQRQTQQRVSIPRPIPLGNKDGSPKYKYSPDATFSANELSFAAHQAAVLGGPMFRENDSGQSLLSPNYQSPQSNRLRHRTSPAIVPPSPPTPPKRKHFTTADTSTKHHIRDPHLGELEVKEIDIGKKSSIPRNILANLLRVTTGDELIEFD